ncbi:MAG: hypothetical protein AB7O45_09505 [Alphaproteobacteria bacterium]
MAAGNRYGALPVVVARVDDGAPARFDGQWVTDRLEAVDPVLAQAFREVEIFVAAGDPDRAAASLIRMVLGLQRMLFPTRLCGVVDRGDRSGEVRCRSETVALGVAREAFDLGERILDASNAPADLTAAVAAWLARHETVVPTIHSLPIVDELGRRQIGWRWQSAAPQALVFGEGRRRRRLGLTITDGTSHLGGEIAENKAQCVRLLAHHRMPVPRQRVVRTADAAAAAAREIGFPVVVKPIDRSGGLAVAVGLRSVAEVVAAFGLAAAESTGVIVESLLVGEDYRLLVVGERLVAASRRLPAHVVGDGMSTVAQLIAAENASAGRRGPAALLRPIVVDDEAVRLLDQQGCALDSVPGQTVRVWLRSAANRSQGGATEDVTGRIHPDNAWLAVRAARLVGLDVAGIDMIAPDIARSVLETGGGICEVNRRPSLLTHVSADGAPAVASALLDHVLAGDAGTSVPIVVVVGGATADAVAQEAAARLEARGHAVGLATRTGMRAAGLPLESPNAGNPRRLAMLVDDPNVTAIVVSAGAHRLSTVGLGHDRCDLAVAVADGAVPALARTVLRWLGQLGGRTEAIDGPIDLVGTADRIVARVLALPGR